MALAVVVVTDVTFVWNAKKTKEYEDKLGYPNTQISLETYTD